MFLTPDDLALLTGRRQKRRQIEQLRTMGIPFYVNAAGSPVVVKSAVQGGATPQQKTVWQPHIVSAGEKR